MEILKYFHSRVTMEYDKFFVNSQIDNWAILSTTCNYNLSPHYAIGAIITQP